MAESAMVAPALRERILAQLKQIELKHKVRVLMAVEAGSRAWGLDSATSDYDVKFVYCHPVEWYLSLDQSTRDTLEVPSENGSLDMNGWELKKTLRLLRESNLSTIEWLQTPIVYFSDQRFSVGATKLISEALCYRSLANHCLHKAKKHHHYYFAQPSPRVALKKYFFVVQPLCNLLWIKSRLESGEVSASASERTLAQRLPPPRLDDLLLAIRPHIPAGVLLILDDLVQRKRNQVLGEGDRLEALDTWILSTLEMSQFFVREAPSTKPLPLDAFNQLCYDLILKPS